MPVAYLIDMDGVLVRGANPIPGAAEFIERLKASGRRFLIFTNNSRYTRETISERFHGMGLRISADAIFTSAMATAQFLDQQCPGGTAFAIGGTGLTTALREIGYSLGAEAPDYVVLGEATDYDFRDLTTAVRLVCKGSRFISTNPDAVDSTDEGPEPACGAIAAMISAATGVEPYAIGKPNPLMMRCALRYLGVHSEDAAIVGDRMDTDMIAGIESGLRTVLVLSGVTREEDIARFPYRPSHIAVSVDSLLR